MVTAETERFARAVRRAADLQTARRSLERALQVIRAQEQEAARELAEARDAAIAADQTTDARPASAVADA